MFLSDLIPRSPLQWAYTCLLGYSMLQLKLIYFPVLSLDSLHECLINVDEKHCGRPSRDWLIAPLDSNSMLQLSQAEQQSLLAHYGELEQNIAHESDCLIGAGYNNCRDLGFRAVDLFEALGPEIKAIQESSNFHPQVHETVSDLESFIETFLYFFEQGSNAEFVSPNSDLFYLLHDRLYEG